MHQLLAKFDDKTRAVHIDYDRDSTTEISASVLHSCGKCRVITLSYDELGEPFYALVSLLHVTKLIIRPASDSEGSVGTLRRVRCRKWYMVSTHLPRTPSRILHIAQSYF